MRKTQVGTGDRSAKIRTYNFPQSRVTDHRIGLTTHDLQGFMDGDIAPAHRGAQARRRRGAARRRRRRNAFMTADGLTKARTVARLAEELARALDECGIAEPVSEAREIVAALFDVPRFWPLTNGHVEVDDAVRARARIAVERRARERRSPTPSGARASATSRWTWTSACSSRARRRNSSSTSCSRTWGRSAGGVAVDVGTGSGAIALALATEGRFARVYGDRHFARRARRRASERGVGPPLVASAGRSRARFAARARCSTSAAEWSCPIRPTLR